MLHCNSPFWVGPDKRSASGRSAIVSNDSEFTPAPGEASTGVNAAFRRGLRPTNEVRGKPLARCAASGVTGKRASDGLPMARRHSEFCRLSARDLLSAGKDSATTAMGRLLPIDPRRHNDPRPVRICGTGRDFPG